MGTVGLVIERKETKESLTVSNGIVKNCHQKLYEKFFTLTDIVSQLPPLLEEFYASEELRTCKIANSYDTSDENYELKITNYVFG